MKIEIGIQANCSEATMRIKLKGHDSKKVEKLIEKFQIECDDYFDEKKTEWDNDELKKEFNFYETSVFEETIFGTKVLTIKGDAPYNSYDDCMTIINRYLKNPIVESGD